MLRLKLGSSLRGRRVVAALAPWRLSRRPVCLPSSLSRPGWSLRSLHSGGGDETRTRPQPEATGAGAGPTAASVGAELRDKRDKLRDKLHPLVTQLNSTLQDFPMPSFIGFIGLSYGVFAVGFVALNAVGFNFPALAVAGAVSRLTRWFKKPVDVALAVGLARAFPVTTAIKLAPLIVPPMTSTPSQPEESDSVVSKWSAFAVRWLEGPVNAYGASFLLARWLTGLSLVSTTTWVVHSGVDITAMLGIFFSDPGSVMAVSSTASAVAGAAVLNTLVLPLRVLFFAQFGRPLFVYMGYAPVLVTPSPPSSATTPSPPSGPV